MKLEAQMKHRHTKEKPDPLKAKNICVLKGCYLKNENQPTDWKKNFASNISNMRPVLGVSEACLQVDN